MDFKLSEQQKELQEIARNFAQNEMVEVALSIEETGEPLSKEWLKKYSEMGFLGINVADKYGGLGLSNLDALLVMEEFAKISSAANMPSRKYPSITTPLFSLNRSGGTPSNVTGTSFKKSVTRKLIMVPSLFMDPIFTIPPNLIR